jgi:hypothetical protein
MDRRDTPPGTQPRFSTWNFRPDCGWSATSDLVGYRVKATDGSVGKVELANHARDESYIVVDTGPWIFGTKVVVPAGTVTHIDHADRVVYLDATKSQVRSGPAYTPGSARPEPDSESLSDYGHLYH